MQGRKRLAFGKMRVKVRKNAHYGQERGATEKLYESISTNFGKGKEKKKRSKTNR